MIEIKKEPRLGQFNDRWEKCNELFNQLEGKKDLFDLTFVAHDETPRRVWTYKYTNKCIAWDKDCMAGLHDWHQPGANFPPENQPDDQGSTINDIVTRDKLYIPEWANTTEIPALEYFYNIRDTFLGDLKQKGKLFNNATQTTLMIVKYDIPKNVDYHSYMFWNFLRFGNDHKDENYGSLHLGESSRAYYYMKNDHMITGNQLSNNYTLWGWGDYATENGYEPTTHGVKYLGGDKKPRYSIIFNLERAR